MTPHPCNSNPPNDAHADRESLTHHSNDPEINTRLVVEDAVAGPALNHRYGQPK